MHIFLTLFSFANTDWLALSFVDLIVIKPAVAACSIGRQLFWVWIAFTDMLLLYTPSVVTEYLIHHTPYIASQTTLLLTKANIFPVKDVKQGMIPVGLTSLITYPIRPEANGLIK